MTTERDPLEEHGEGLPVSPVRRRFALAAGVLILLLILVSLTWFIATNTETEDNRGSLYGLVHAPPGGEVG